MPASLFSSDMDRNSRALEEQRALEVAYNIHTLFLNNDNECLTNSYDGEHRSKKSQNTTECVPVPSSEHVAEIVGRQGCKIKALRAKTNTYIKTPVRGEEPVFVVTGRKEDVNAAKREILSAAEHFSQIRAQRKNNLNGTLIPGPNSNIPGQTTIQVRVPYRVVGLVVGPKGATIKRIQQTTNTYIVTPSRDKEPVFEVTGLPDNVESARKEIEAHIAMRTGGALDDCCLDDFNNPLESLTNNLNAISNSFFKGEPGYMFHPRADNNSLLDVDNIFGSFGNNRSKQQNDLFNSGFGFGNAFSYDVDEGLGDSPTFETTSSWPDFGTSTLTDSGLFGSGSSSAGLSSDLSQRSNSISGALSDLILRSTDDQHPPARRIHSDPLSVPEVGDLLSSLGLSPFAGGAAPAFPPAVSQCTSSSSSPPMDPPLKKSLKRDCVVCFESEIVAALVPCGHNNFCMECAQRIVDNKEATCPVCCQSAIQAMRIYN